MNNNISYRVISVFLAVFILISSTGISLNIHFCGNEIFDYSVFGKPKICKSGKIAHIDDANLRVTKPSCCSHSNYKIETSDEYSSLKFDKETILAFELNFLKIETQTFIENSILIWDNNSYPPPDIKTNDIYLRIESFLI